MSHCAGARQLLAQLHQVSLLLLPVALEQGTLGVQLGQVVLALVELGSQRGVLARLLERLAGEERVLARHGGERLGEDRWHGYSVWLALASRNQFESWLPPLV